jgi:cytochrome c
MRPLLILPATLLLGLFASQAWAGDPVAGHQLAVRWCSSCHAVDELHAGQGGVPSFALIGAGSGRDKAHARAWLMAPHPPMPDLNLTRVEIDNVLAYIDTLSPPKGN